MKSISSKKDASTDTLLRLKKTKYGKFQMPEQVNPVAIGFSIVQIVGIVFGTCELFRQLVFQRDALSCVGIAFSGLFLLYAAVIRFLYAMSTYQMTRQVRRPHGKSSYYDVFMSKMTSITYSVECIAYSLMQITLNKGIPALLVTVIGPSIIVLTLVIVCISIVRNVSYFDTSLTQTFNIIFNMIVLLGISSFRGEDWTAIFFALEIFGSILDAISAGLPMNQGKGLGKGANCAILFGLMSIATRTASIATYFLAAYMVANRISE